MEEDGWDGGPILKSSRVGRIPTMPPLLFLITHAGEELRISVQLLLISLFNNFLYAVELTTFTFSYAFTIHNALKRLEMSRMFRK